MPNLPPGTDPAAVAAFQEKTAEAARRRSSAKASRRIKGQLRRMRATLGETPKADLALYGSLAAVSQAVAEARAAAQRRPGAAKSRRAGNPIDRWPYRDNPRRPLQQPPVSTATQ